MKNSMKRLFLSSNFVDSGDGLIELVPKPQGLKAVYISTASEPYESAPWVEADKNKLASLGFEVEHYEIKNKTEEIIYEELKNTDVILVCGGNSFYLLQEVRKSGFDKAVSRLINEGKIYIGSSAGSLLAGPSLEPIKNIDKMEKAPELKSLDTLNIVAVVILPHLNAEKYKERNENALTNFKDKYKMIAINDNQAVVVIDDKVNTITI